MRASLVVLAAALLLLAGGAQGALVNYYSFNNQTLADTASTYAQGGGTNATNLIMNDPSGLCGTTYVAGITSKYDPTETGNYAINIKGQYQAYQAESLDMPTGNADVNLGTSATIEFWVHTGDSNTYGGHTNASFLTATNYNIATTAGNSQTLNVTGGTAIGGLSWNPTMAWHHVAVVFRPDGTYSYFFDGAKRDSTYNTATFGTTTAWKIGVAGTARYTPSSVDVYVDDLAMWNEALSDATIQAHKTAGGLGLTLTPEPATMTVLGLGGLVVCFRRRRAA